MAETIAVLSLKGGTGKTTTVRTLADVLRRVGLSVLAIDLDPQGNLSDYFDVPPDAAPTVADVLGGEAKASEAVHDGIIPATPILAEVERSMSGKMGRELVLRKALKGPRQSYDVILIDCPPALGLLTVNGLVAADWAIVSAEAQYFALQGVQGALDVVEQAKEYYNPDLELVGVLMNIADMRTVHSREAYESLERALPGQGLRDRHPLLDRLRGVGREREVDPRPPPRPRRRLPRAGRRAAQAHRPRRPAAQAAADARRHRVERLPCGGRPSCSASCSARGLRRRAAPRPRSACRSRPSGEGRCTRPQRRRPRRSGRYLTAPRARARPRCAPAPAAARCTASARAPSSARRRVLSVTARRGGWLAVIAPERPNGRVGWIPERRVRAGEHELVRSTSTARRAG